jgi:hypothetical protein
MTNTDRGAAVVLTVVCLTEEGGIVGVRDNR